MNSKIKVYSFNSLNSYPLINHLGTPFCYFYLKIDKTNFYLKLYLELIFTQKFC